MELKGIKYKGPIFDNSGYAKACRENIIALYKSGVPITLAPMSFEKARPDLGEDSKILDSLVHKDIDYENVILHCTPEFYEKQREEGKRNIGYTIWETTKLHPKWPHYINNNVDACMVGCDWNVDVFKNSGITVPLFNIPHVANDVLFKTAGPYNVGGVKDDAFVFGFVSQWTERKHPLALIKAYWHAFQNQENVALVMKTYRSDYSEGEKDAIRTTIKRLKMVMPMDNYPPIYLVLDMLTEEEMAALFARFDCYTSLDRGEGFGLGPFQAAAQAKPIIVTGFGGVTEYAKPEHSYLVDYHETPVHGMPWSPWYNGSQLWAEPSIKHGADLMRHVYENQDEAKARGLKAQQYIKDNFSWQVIGKRIIDAIRSL